MGEGGGLEKVAKRWIKKLNGQNDKKVGVGVANSKLGIQGCSHSLHIERFSLRLECSFEPHCSTHSCSAHRQSLVGAGSLTPYPPSAPPLAENQMPLSSRKQRPLTPLVFGRPAALQRCSTAALPPLRAQRSGIGSSARLGPASAVIQGTEAVTAGMQCSCLPPARDDGRPSRLRLRSVRDWCHGNLCEIEWRGHSFATACGPVHDRAPLRPPAQARLLDAAVCADPAVSRPNHRLHRPAPADRRRQQPAARDRPRAEGGTSRGAATSRGAR